MLLCVTLFTLAAYHGCDSAVAPHFVSRVGKLRLITLRHQMTLPKLGGRGITATLENDMVMKYDTAAHITKPM